MAWHTISKPIFLGRCGLSIVEIHRHTMVHMHMCSYKQRHIWFIGQAVSSHFTFDSMLTKWESMKWKYPNLSTCQSFRELLANYSLQENKVYLLNHLFVATYIIMRLDH